MLRALGLGDFLTGIPAYRAISRAFPGHHITLAAPIELAPLAELVGGIDEVVDTAPLAPLARSLTGAGVGIDLHGCGPKSHRVVLDAHPQRFIGFAHPDVPESLDCAVWRSDEHEVARWCRLLTAAGIACDPEDLDLAVPAIAVPESLVGATLLHPGAASESRRWPIDGWVAVAQAERQAGRRVILTGGVSERDRVAAIAARASIPDADVYGGRTTLPELAAIVASAGRVVCGDTGVAHLATAYRRPSVVLFGPTPPATWGPPERPYHRVLWHGTTGDPHGAAIDPGLHAIAPDRVIAALRDLPERLAHPRHRRTTTKTVDLQHS